MKSPWHAVGLRHAAGQFHFPLPAVVNRSNRRKAYLRRLTNPVQVGNEKPQAKR